MRLDSVGPTAHTVIIRTRSTSYEGFVAAVDYDYMHTVCSGEPQWAHLPSAPFSFPCFRFHSLESGLELDPDRISASHSMYPLLFPIEKPWIVAVRERCVEIRTLSRYSVETPSTDRSEEVAIRSASPNPGSDEGK
ncbi:unnamed protein product [Aspergillus oryzae]|uniref:Unnamed protein product n=1 Tax=Aspergillus oryzae var. brunneus TaxID=332754 RepID=A0ABQ6KK72_ASPOZ|nr:unnamed protein product [Aspergillus oryzae]GMF87125.1 unnamed protein product [Aspergillus oryzae]GMG08455.1 unnamed protein product [Aspergillus oryzae]GMG45541.1 unnamed protein product [Aspergillus oryzae var. brunneus]